VGPSLAQAFEQLRVGNAVFLYSDTFVPQIQLVVVNRLEHLAPRVWFWRGYRDRHLPFAQDSYRLRSARDNRNLSQCLEKLLRGMHAFQHIRKRPRSDTC